MKVKPIRTRVFVERENLDDFIFKYFPTLPERSIVVVTSKIVALAEGRTAVPKSVQEKTALIKKESDYATQTKYVWLTIKDGMVMANAGVDESNADGKIILLPKDSFRAAQKIRTALQKKYGRKEIGVIVTDSRTVPLRAGVMGVALGYAGFKGARDYRGKSDIFGRMLRMTRTDIADSLAAAAVMVMGEGAERHPLALITDAPVEFKDTVSRKELLIPIEEDMYRPLFRRIRL